MIPKKLLLQTTIQYTEDDWHIGRFSLLAEHLRSITGDDGNPIYEVESRDREASSDGVDPVLASIDASEFDQLWLFALDMGDGLTKAECEAITRFRKRGGGLYTTRDHFDLGSSLCTLGGVGEAHYFNSSNPDPDPSRRRRDDQVTTSIDYPNYHSGANGDFQKILARDHDLLRRPDDSLIQYFPAHPHEGGVGAPTDEARVVATGQSKVTGSDFNIIVAIESADGEGRAIADSSFHHIVDYNWDIEAGCPSFLEEPPGDGYRREPEKLDDIKQFVANAAKWLSPEK